MNGLNCTALARRLGALCVAVIAVACGGSGGEDAPGDGSGGQLTLSAAAPAAMNGVIDLNASNDRRTVARAADPPVTTVPECEVHLWGAAHSADARPIAVSVFFRQSDAQVLGIAVSTMGGNSNWFVGDFDRANGIAGVALNVATRTVTLNGKVLLGTSTSGFEAIVSGSFVFAAGSGVAACGG
jgi:hypothetical protein